MKFLTRLILVTLWLTVAGIAYSLGNHINTLLYVGWPTLLLYAVSAIGSVYALTNLTKLLWNAK